jgi:hypothetical protein
VPRVENVPGRRKAAPPPRSSRADRAARDLPARARSTDTLLAEDRPTPQTLPDRRPRRSATALGLVWLLLVGGAAGGLIALRAVEAVRWEQQAVATALGVLLALGLAARSGGHPVPAAALALVVGGAATATQWPVLLAGAAMGTGVLAACLAVLGTTPAASFGSVVREVVLAQSLATVGALGVAGFGVDLSPTRFAYTVLGVSLVATVAMVYRLGGGLHGLGPRGLALGLATVALLALVLAYSEALGHWGPPGMTEQIDAIRFGMRDRIGAVPHPIEVLVGLPALAWGVFVRARRRQGWWLSALGTAATAPATTRFVDVGSSPLNTVLAAGYSIVLGLLLAWVLIRAEQALHGSRGRRARRGEEAAAHRPEPDRLRPLH